ncbi:hypothetical protein [Thioclava sp.]|uniref:hypothetical protein n=1 Tax=Thioclava sp. TaxID=1933450 RepID=UPI003241E794
MTARTILIDQLPDTLRWGIGFNNATSHSERLDYLEKALDNSYDLLTDARKEFAPHSEDALTRSLMVGLNMAGITANHDPQLGGHVDLVVEGKGGFRWIGEAKIYNGPAYIFGGYKQLTTRYGVAAPGRDTGEIIIYCKQSRATERLDDWKAHLVENGEDVSVTVQRTEEKPFEFRTENSCKATGLRFRTRHRIVPLYHNPEK